MVERMNGLTRENTTKADRYGTAEAILADLYGWLVRYDFCHENQRIGGKPPYEVVLAWYKEDPPLFLRELTVLRAHRSQPGERPTCIGKYFGP